MLTAEIYAPKTRKVGVTIEHQKPGPVVDALGERLGVDAATKADRAIKSMRKEGFDLTQFKLPDGHRIRIKQG
jgi:hypothetical protein